MDYYDFTKEDVTFPLYYRLSAAPESLTRIQQFVDDQQKSYTDSLVFNMTTKENELHEELRQSKKVSLNKPELFKLINETIMQDLNKQAKPDGFIMQLVEDEVDLIQYDEGGHFDKHRDFVNFISDQMKCYSLLLCLEGTQEGGETKLYFPDNTVEITETRTTGGCAVFRNEIFHEGCKILKGKKVILKMNIRCFRNYAGIVDSNDYLIVRFPNEQRLYILHDFMYMQYSKSIFALHKTFQKTNEITLQNVTYDQFKPIYDFMLGDWDCCNEFQACRELMDYLGITSTKVEVLQSYHDKLMEKYKIKINELNDFLNSRTKLWLVKSYDDYLTYKEVMKDMPNIIPIQFMLSYEERNKKFLECLSVYDCVPIYVRRDENDVYRDNYTPDSDTSDREKANQEDEDSLDKPRKRIDPFVWLKTKRFTEQTGETVPISKIRLLMVRRYLGSKANSSESPRRHHGSAENEKYIDMLETDNAYDYLKAFMSLSFDLAWDKLDEYADKDFTMFNKSLEEELNTDETFPVNKLTETIELFQEYDVPTMLSELNDKRVCFKDYTVGAYQCNEANYHLQFSNIYFGFVNL